MAVATSFGAGFFHDWRSQATCLCLSGEDLELPRRFQKLMPFT